MTTRGRRLSGKPDYSTPIGTSVDFTKTVAGMRGLKSEIERGVFRDRRCDNLIAAVEADLHRRHHSARLTSTMVPLSWFRVDSHIGSTTCFRIVNDVDAIP
jgi:hypothetical protein